MSAHQHQPTARRAARRGAWFIAVIVAALGLLVAVPAVASAAPQTMRTAHITGAEYAFTSTVGSFAGFAFGQLNGAFDTEVVHDPLAAGPVRITGGTFTVRSNPAVAGTITGGLIQPQPVAGCRDQRFTVTGTLALSRPGPGTGSFAVTETHVQRIVLGQCRVVFATIDGTLTIRY